MTGGCLFVGGGNMARAIIAGQLAGGVRSESITVIEPEPSTADALQRDFAGVTVLRAVEQAQKHLGASAAEKTVVWAVKPQVLQSAMQAFTAPAALAGLHLSIAAGVPVAALKAWLGGAAGLRVVRAMPNTPALVGKGMTGLYAGPELAARDRDLARQIAQAVGQVEWVEREEQLDAVTALSGSGPAYVFYFLEAMQEAGMQLGLPGDQAYRLALATFAGAAALADDSAETPEALRQRVTSKGGTTFAGISALEAKQVKAHFIAAMLACHDRAKQLGQELS